MESGAAAADKFEDDPAPASNESPILAGALKGRETLVVVTPTKQLNRQHHESPTSTRAARPPRPTNNRDSPGLFHCCTKSNATTQYEKIAIIGMGMRYPNSINNETTLMEFLEMGGDAIRDVPPDRWNLEEFYHPDSNVKGKAYVKRASFLHDDDIKKFDPHFFGISPIEAETLDPQQRILLEIAFEAFQDAGIPITKMKGKKVGTFIGTFNLDNQSKRMTREALDELNQHSTQSGSSTMLSNRIAHVFDFAGPSISVDTACSASLVAMHLACQSIQNGDSEIALAGGVNVILLPYQMVSMCKSKFLAVDGQSKAFFDRADGYGRGEGAGVVLLKKLSRAIEDGDNIHAVIDATSVNQDGRTPGISQPSKEAQIRNMRSALEKAAMDPLQIGYVEAHGTGTKAGDPIELNALGAVYGLPSRRLAPLPVGSIKPNINHTEAAAGISGLIKAVLTVKYGRVLPHLNLGKLNQMIQFSDLNVKIPLFGERWHMDKGIHTAAVNSFGYGGTNAHAIVSHFVKDKRKLAKIRQQWRWKSKDEKNNNVTIQISAKSEVSLEGYIRRMSSWVKTHSDSVSIHELANHLNYHVDRFQYMLAFRVGGVEDFSMQLEEALCKPQRIPLQPVALSKQKIAWVFTGMGPQWWGMGQELYSTENVFRSKLDACDKLYVKVSGGKSLLSEMIKTEGESKIASNQSLAQCANFFVQVGLADLLMSWGFRPDAIVGHSVGEIAAAVVSGSLDLNQGIKVIYHRGETLQKLVGHGTMLAAGIGEEEYASRFIDKYPEIDVAAINGMKSIVLSGSRETLVLIESELVRDEIFAKLMRVDVPYHSASLDSVQVDLCKALKFLKPKAPKITTYSTVSGGRLARNQDATYWFDNCRQCVQLHGALQTMLNENICTFVEIGPHPVLTPSIDATIDGRQGISLHTLRRNRGEVKTIMSNLVQLIQFSGNAPDTFLTESTGAKRLQIPFNYVWDKRILWSECWKNQITLGTHDVGSKLPFLQTSAGAAVDGIIYPTWKSFVRTPGLQFLEDHKVGGHIILPGAGYVECALEAAKSTIQTTFDTLVIDDIIINTPLIISNDLTQKIHIEVRQNEISVASVFQGACTIHMSGRINPFQYFELPTRISDTRSFYELKSDKVTRMYQDFRKLGIDYGISFQGIKAILPQADCVYSSLIITHRHEEENNFLVHPALLDSAFQSLFFLLRKESSDGALPVEIGRVVFRKKLTNNAFSFAKMVSRDKKYVVVDIMLLNEDMEICCKIESLRCQFTKATNIDSRIDEKGLLYKFVHRPLDDVDSLDPINLPIVPHFEVNEMNNSSDCQVLVDFRKFDLKDDVYSDSIDRAVFLLDLVKKISSPEYSRYVKRVVVLLQDAINDESKFPVRYLDPRMSSLAGMLRTVSLEVMFDIKVIDCDRSSDQILQKLLQSAFSDDELILREGVACYNSLEKSSASFPEREKFTRYQDFSQPKYLEHSKSNNDPFFREFSPSALHHDEVRLKVHLSSYGRLNDNDNVLFGGKESRYTEVIGEVQGMGDDVKTISQSDLVYTVAMRNRLESHVIAEESMCVKVPRWTLLEDAVQIVDGIKSYLAMISMGRLRRDEVVLVNIEDRQLASWVRTVALGKGAVVHTIANSKEEEDEMLRLGVNAISTLTLASSHSFDMMVVDQNITSKTEVFSLMRPCGRIIVLSEHERFAEDPMQKRLKIEQTIQVMKFDFQMMINKAPSLLCDAVKNAFVLLTKKKLSIPPARILPSHGSVDELSSGFAAGKIVVDFRNSEAVPTALKLRQSIVFGSNDVALVTGGCSGFGLRSALRLVDWGLKHLILAGRRGVVEEEYAAQEIEDLRNQGINIMEVSLDVTDRGAIDNLLSNIDNRQLKLCGIIHSATSFADKILSATSREDFVRGYETKALGAWNLHNATMNRELYFFICYSSITSCIGNQGQSAYAASNSFLTGLMAYRNNKGLAGTSISWGRIAEVGVMMRLQEAVKQHDNYGINSINPDEGIEIMKDIVLGGHPHVAIHNIDWGKWFKNSAGRVLIASKFKVLKQSLGHSGLSNRVHILESLMKLDRVVRVKTVEQILMHSLKTITGSLEVTPSVDMSAYGIDSLAAMSIQFSIKETMCIDLTVIEILGAANVSHVAETCCQRIKAEYSALTGDADACC